MKLGFLYTLKTVGTLSTKIAIVAAASIGGASLVSSSVFAALTATATNTSGGAVSSGLMSLTQAPGLGFSNVASGGFVTTIPAMAPLDSVNRLVTLTNSSTLNAASMTVAVVDGTPTVLTTGSTGFTGLTTTITQCPTAYTQASAGAVYVCASGETTVRASATILSLATPQTLSVQAATLLAGGTAFLKITVSLPDSTEVTVNGAAPGVGSVQSKTANLTWTITAAQRTATSTNT